MSFWELFFFMCNINLPFPCLLFFGKGPLSAGSKMFPWTYIISPSTPKAKVQNREGIEEARGLCLVNFYKAGAKVFQLTKSKKTNAIKEAFVLNCQTWKIRARKWTNFKPARKFSYQMNADDKKWKNLHPVVITLEAAVIVTTLEATKRFTSKFAFTAQPRSFNRKKSIRING